MSAGTDPTPRPTGDIKIVIDTSSPGGSQWPEGDMQMDFLFFPADTTFDESVSPNYASVGIIGRSEAYKVWIGNENRLIPLNIVFLPQGDEEGRPNAGFAPAPPTPSAEIAKAYEKEVKKKVDWLMATAMPVYRDIRTYPPPVILLFMGKMFNRSGLPIRCIVESASVSYDGYDPVTMLPYVATVNLSLCQVARDKNSLPQAPMRRSPGV